MNEVTEIPRIEDVVGDPASSYWLKENVRTAMARDPVDALNDAILLAALLDQHLREVLELGLAG